MIDDNAMFPVRLSTIRTFVDDLLESGHLAGLKEAATIARSCQGDAAKVHQELVTMIRDLERRVP